MCFDDIVFENAYSRLTLGADAAVKSLVLKSTGEELIDGSEQGSMFSITQLRPFNNEVKLAYPNKKRRFFANGIKKETDGTLTVSFEIIPCRASVSVKVTDAYISFRLEGFITGEKDYPAYMDTPPVVEFGLVRIPVKERKNFGEWLNVSWDNNVAVAVVATSPHARIDAERRHGARVMCADAVKEIKLVGCEAAIICTEQKDFMEAMDQLEIDYGLPRGARLRQDRRATNSSIYWVYDLNPETVDEHIAYAKRGGFSMMLVYFTSIFKSEYTYDYCGDYDYLPCYPGGLEDLREVVNKVKNAGIRVGLHILQTFIGKKSRYVTPKADPRLNIKRFFALSQPLSKDDNTVYVCQNPDGSPMSERTRVLKFGGELISYTSYTTEPPYRFIGCERGAWNTDVCEHKWGDMGGILDVSEFDGDVYIDQSTDLQDEVAKKIADAYNVGFEFMYYDGSEGANPPYEFHVPNAQYRVHKKLIPEPILSECAAKAHFGWHFMNGGNAFDVFPSEVFKRSIDRYPLEEAARMRQDFTRVNFGWWEFRGPGTQADLYEYGTSHAAGWDCPVTIQADLPRQRDHARTDDIFEVMRRWEDVRAKDWLSDDQKLAIREPGREHTLLINENHDYELAEYREITTSADGLRAFSFSRAGKAYVVFWHTSDEGMLKISGAYAPIYRQRELYEEPVMLAWDANGVLNIPVSSRAYVFADMAEDDLRAIFEKAYF